MIDLVPRHNDPVRLVDANGSCDRLVLDRGIPLQLDDEDAVRCREVESEGSRACRHQHDPLAGLWLGEFVENLLSFGEQDLAVDAEEGDLVA